MNNKLRGIPAWFWLPAILTLVVLVLPLIGMAGRVPWGNLGGILTTPEATDALWLSLRTCLISTALTVSVGTPLALIFARASENPPWWLTPVRALVLVPLVMPPVVAGLALLTTFGRKGVLGSTLEAFGLSIPFTTLAVILAQIFVSLPFLVVTVETAAKAAGSHLEHAAQSLGASRWTQFSRVTLPLLFPALISGAALAFARSLGEFGATITFAGSLQGVTRTLPLEVYLQREQDADTALALSLILIALALLLTGITTAVSAREARRFQQSAGGATVLTDGGTDPIAPAGPIDAVSRGASAVPVSAAPVSAAPWTLHARVPERRVNLSLTGPAGQTVALIGPNGAGKSTALRLLAGDITSTESAVDAPERIGFLDQSPSLFPHLSVLENVAFGPRCHGVPAPAARERACRELAAVGLSDLAEKAPWQLSGGQAQRVALARMLAVDPQLLLLDEPLAALDRNAAATLRSVIGQRTRTGLSTVMVTHDLLDVIALADHVAVLDSGQLVAFGETEEILANPPNAFVAEFSGVNMFVGEVTEATASTVSLRSGAIQFAGMPTNGMQLAAGARASVVFPPAAVALYRTAPSGSPRNRWAGKVLDVQAGTDGMTVQVDIGAPHSLRATVTAAAIRDLALVPGDEVFSEVKAVQVRVFPRG